MKLKLDENLSRHLKPIMLALQHDVTTTTEEGLLSQPGPVVGAAAKNEGRMLLTLDLEFADMRKYAPGNHPGVVLIRPRSFGPLTVNRAQGERQKEGKSRQNPLVLSVAA